jgi:hypothetical protein
MSEIPGKQFKLLAELITLYKSLGVSVSLQVTTGLESEENSGCRYVLRLPHALDAIGVIYQHDYTIFIKYAYPFTEIETMLPRTLIVPTAEALLDGYLGERGIKVWAVCISYFYGIPKKQIKYDAKSITIQLK